MNNFALALFGSFMAVGVIAIFVIIPLIVDAFYLIKYPQEAEATRTFFFETSVITPDGSTDGIDVNVYYLVKDESSIRFGELNFIGDRLNYSWGIQGLEEYIDEVYFEIVLGDTKYRIAENGIRTGHPHEILQLDLNRDGKNSTTLKLTANEMYSSNMYQVSLILEPDPFYFTVNWILDGEQRCYALITFSDGIQKIYNEIPDMGEKTRYTVLNQSFKDEVCDQYLTKEKQI